jgi:putative glutamine amidotransferase
MKEPQRLGHKMVKIGLSARFFTASPKEFGIGGKPVQYLEQSMANALARAGSVVFLIPSIGTMTELCSESFHPMEYAKSLDALVLQGGVDISPAVYGEQPISDAIVSDPLRDKYELALIDCFLRLKKPVLGICRGMQLINTYMGGSLYQDIPTQLQSPVVHYCESNREHNEHDVEILPNTYLSRLYGNTRHRVNSVHHQSVKTLGRDLVIEAVCPSDQVVEAIRYTGDSYLVGVQWHPEFHDVSKNTHLNSQVLFKDFFNAASSQESGLALQIAR